MIIILSSNSNHPFFINFFTFFFADSANDMNTNAYKAAIHKVHERTIYEPSNALPFYVRECGGGWACLESRHKDWRFYYLTINTRFTDPEVVMQWSLNPQVIYMLKTSKNNKLSLIAFLFNRVPGPYKHG